MSSSVTTLLFTTESAGEKVKKIRQPVVLQFLTATHLSTAVYCLLRNILHLLLLLSGIMLAARYNTSVAFGFVYLYIDRLNVLLKPKQRSATFMSVASTTFWTVSLALVLAGDLKVRLNRMRCGGAASGANKRLHCADGFKYVVARAHTHTVGFILHAEN